MKIILALVWYNAWAHLDYRRISRWRGDPCDCQTCAPAGLFRRFHSIPLLLFQLLLLTMAAVGETSTCADESKEHNPRQN